MPYHDDRQPHYVLLVLCIPFLVSARSFPAIPECGEVKIAIKTNEGYICVCNREENHFTISDGRTCGFLSGGCPLGEELQDNGECRACQRGTFKNISGAGLCKEQTDCRILGLLTVSDGDSAEDAKCGSTLITDITRTTEQSTIEPDVSATGGSTTHNDEGSSGVITIVLSTIAVLVGIVIVCACVCIKRHIWTMMWRHVRKNNSSNAPSDGDHEGTQTGLMNGGLTTPEEVPLTASSQSSQRKFSEMTDEQSKCLLKVLFDFVQRMTDMKKVCDFLLSSGVLTPSVFNAIMAKETPEDRARELHMHILKQPAQAFDDYYKALSKSGNKDLAQKLMPHLTSNVSMGQGAMKI